MTSDPKITEFCKNHGMKILDIKERARYRMTPFPYHLGSNKKEYSAHMECDTEAVYNIEVSEERLHHLMEFEKQVYLASNRGMNGRTDTSTLIDYLLNKEYSERQLRKSHPTLEKLYDQYLMMLGLIKSGET